jgi:hypothetical protein
VSATVCLGARTVDYPTGGGHAWVFLNWALGLRALGCRVIWLEQMPQRGDPAERIGVLEERLRGYGLDEIALVEPDGTAPTLPAAQRHLDLDGAASEADLLLNMMSGFAPEIVAPFRRAALLDIDPGLLQVWWTKGWVQIAPHDVYLTIGETVGTPDALFPDAGVEWHHVRPAVHLDIWTVADDSPTRPFTTVSHWPMNHQENPRPNTKRHGFLPYLDLPALTCQQLELAISMFGEPVPAELVDHGWSVVDAWEVAGTSGAYRDYIRSSRGEFSCVKPSCVEYQNAWVSDRTVCYFASGRPAVIEHTGPSRFLPDAEGLFRFRSPAEAAAQLETVAADYERQSRFARALAEEYFDSRKNAARALEIVLSIKARG